MYFLVKIIKLYKILEIEQEHNKIKKQPNSLPSLSYNEVLEIEQHNNKIESSQIKSIHLIFCVQLKDQEFDFNLKSTSII